MYNFSDLKNMREAYVNVTSLCDTSGGNRNLIGKAIKLYTDTKTLELQMVDKLMNSTLNMNEFVLHCENIKMLSSHSERAFRSLKRCGVM